MLLLLLLLLLSVRETTVRSLPHHPSHTQEVQSQLIGPSHARREILVQLGVVHIAEARTTLVLMMMVIQRDIAFIESTEAVLMLMTNPTSEYRRASTGEGTDQASEMVLAFHLWWQLPAAVSKIAAASTKVDGPHLPVDSAATAA